MPIDRITGVDDANFGFDELVAKDVDVHIERMSSDHIWLKVTDKDRTVTLNFHIQQRTIWVGVHDEREL